MTDLSTVTPQALAQEIAGNGMTISNVQFNQPGATAAAGKFSGGNGIIGFSTGVILSSGAASNISSTVNQLRNTSAQLGLPGDADLDGIATPYQTEDAIVLEFDFIPNDDRVSFDFVFASDEYNEYVGTPYNDVFGFFVNGVNCALVGPNGDPVTINTVNFNQNVQLYQNNDPFDPPFRQTSHQLEADGFTKVLTATATVTPNVVNHVRFAIADTSDQSYDSWVMIRTDSFQVGDPVVVTKTAANPTSSPGGANAYTITLTNQSNTAHTLTEIEDFLPAGFTYTAGSSTGITTANPSVSGRTLTWTGPFVIPALGSAQLNFNVTVSPISGTYYNSALARGNAPIVPSGDTAPVTIAHPNPLKWVADFDSLGISSTTGLYGFGSPVVAPDGTTFLPAVDGSALHLLGVKPNGTLATGFPAPIGTLYDVPASSVTLGHGGRMLALGDAVYCVAYKHASASDGVRLWRYPSNTGSTLTVSRSSIALDTAGNAYFVDDNNKLYGLSPSGTELWAPVTVDASLAHDVVSSPVIGRNGLLYLISDPASYGDPLHVIAVNTATGATVHQVQLASDQAGGSPVVLADGNLLVSTYAEYNYNGTLTVLSPTLAVKGQWIEPNFAGIKATPIVSPSNAVFVGSTGGVFHKLQLSYDGSGNASFTPVWNYQSATSTAFNGPAVLSIQNNIVLAAEDGRVHFLKDLGSSFLAEVPYVSNGMIRSSPALGPDGTIYVNSHAVGLHAFHGTDAVEPRGWTSWRNGRTGRANALDVSPQATSIPIPPTFALTRFVDPANPSTGFGSNYGQVYTVNNNQAAYGMGQGGAHDGVFELYQNTMFDLGIYAAGNTPVINQGNDRHYAVGRTWDGVTRDGVNNPRFFPLWYHRGATPWQISAHDAMPNGVNVHGLVCGDVKTSTIVQAPPGGPRIRVLQYALKPAVWEAGVPTFLPDTTPAYYSSYARDINSSGTVCGFNFNGPLIWTRGPGGYTAQYLPNSIAGTVEVRAINDAGIVVGWGIANSTMYGSVWIPDANGQYTQYVHQDCRFEDINNFGLIVGSHTNAASLWQATGPGTYSRINLNTRFSDATWTTLYTALTINDSNYIGGYGSRSYKIQGYILKP